jgi:hypothetical protein
VNKVLNRLSRLTPLTGVVFAVLAAAAFVTAPGAPGATASGGRVIAFYEAHGSSAQASDYLWMFAFAFLLLFAGSLREYLRRSQAAEALSSLLLAGAAVLAAGATVYFGFDFALATVPSHLAPAAAQALNVLALKLFLPVSAGGLVFGIASGLAILRGAQLPKWLGWLAIVIGIVTATPAGLVGIVAFIFWTAIVSVLIWRRSGAEVETPRAVAAVAVGPRAGST